jgi:hypothetical protein
LIYKRRAKKEAKSDTEKMLKFVKEIKGEKAGEVDFESLYKERRPQGKLDGISGL